MTAQAQRILASTARRGAGLMREVAYTEAAVRIGDGSVTTAEATALFRARDRFTPGWSSRPMVAQGLAVIQEGRQAAQEPWQRSWPTLVAPESTSGDYGE